MLILQKGTLCLLEQQTQLHWAVSFEVVCN